MTIRDVMPGIAELPVHPAFTQVAFPGRPRGARLTKWTRGNGQWWLFRRELILGHYDRAPAAVIRVNGGGEDHELRFTVYDERMRATFDHANLADAPDCPRCHGTRFYTERRGEPSNFMIALTEIGMAERVVPDPNEMVTRSCTASGCMQGKQVMYGAANSFQYTPGIGAFIEGVSDDVQELGHEHLTYVHSSRSLGSRGLYAFTRADVLGVARWADGLLAKLYPPLVKM